MKPNFKTNHFKYGFFPQKSQELLQSLSKENPKKFEEVINIGSSIESFSNNEDVENLSKLIDQNVKNLNYLSCFVKEAFLSALNFKYYEVVQYFLENGLSLQDDNFKDCLLTLCRISKFTLSDLPYELMDLLLLYGADANYCEQGKFKTPLHIACKHGMMQFAVSLITKGKAEVNPVDKNKKTPLNYLEEKIKKGKKFQELYNFIESNGGQLDWRI